MCQMVPHCGVLVFHNFAAAFKRSTSSVTREEVHRFWKAKRSMMEKQLQEAQRDVSHARTIALVSCPCLKHSTYVQVITTVGGGIPIIVF